jgi:hypothetical protein
MENNHRIVVCPKNNKCIIDVKYIKQYECLAFSIMDSLEFTVMIIKPFGSDRPEWYLRRRKDEWCIEHYVYTQKTAKVEIKQQSKYKWVVEGRMQSAQNVKLVLDCNLSLDSFKSGLILKGVMECETSSDCEKNTAKCYQASKDYVRVLLRDVNYNEGLLYNKKNN